MIATTPETIGTVADVPPKSSRYAACTAVVKIDGPLSLLDGAHTSTFAPGSAYVALRPEASTAHTGITPRWFR